MSWPRDVDAWHMIQLSLRKMPVSEKRKWGPLELRSSLSLSLPLPLYINQPLLLCDVACL